MSFVRSIAGRRCQIRQARFRTFATVADARTQPRPQGNKVKIVEVGPRDGLQNEKKSIPLATKLQLIRRLAATGLTDIEAGSFVAPKWVPQMANSSEILEEILVNTPPSTGPINYSFLAPNMRGFENAMSVLQKYAYPPSSNEQDKNPRIEFAVFPAATESFTQKNLNCDIATSLERFKPVIQGAKAAGFRVRAYISVVLGCPFEGYVDPRKVADMATDLLAMGADEIDLGDTTGMGTAPRTAELLRSMAAAGVRIDDIAMHFHDTYGQALVNTAVSLEHGIRTFDSSVGGLGGCPYSPGATGNVATEDMVYFLESLGMETGIDLDELAEIGSWIATEIGKPNSSSVGKALLGKKSRL